MFSVTDLNAEEPEMLGNSMFFTEPVKDLSFKIVDFKSGKTTKGVEFYRFEFNCVTAGAHLGKKVSSTYYDQGPAVVDGVQKKGGRWKFKLLIKAAGFCEDDKVASDFKVGDLTGRDIMADVKQQYNNPEYMELTKERPEKPAEQWTA